MNIILLRKRLGRSLRQPGPHRRLFQKKPKETEINMRGSHFIISSLLPSPHPHLSLPPFPLHVCASMNTYVCGGQRTLGIIFQVPIPSARSLLRQTFSLVGSVALTAG